MKNNHVSWSRTPSKDTVSHVFIPTEYDTMTPEDKASLPTMLNIYTEHMAITDKYENIKRLMIFSVFLVLLGGWFYLGIMANK